MSRTKVQKEIEKINRKNAIRIKKEQELNDLITNALEKPRSLVINRNELDKRNTKEFFQRINKDIENKGKFCVGDDCKLTEVINVVDESTILDELNKLAYDNEFKKQTSDMQYQDGYIEFTSKEFKKELTNPNQKVIKYDDGGVERYALKLSSIFTKISTTFELAFITYLAYCCKELGVDFYIDKVEFDVDWVSKNIKNSKYYDLIQYGIVNDFYKKGFSKEITNIFTKFPLKDLDAAIFNPFQINNKDYLIAFKPKYIVEAVEDQKLYFTHNVFFDLMDRTFVKDVFINTKNLETAYLYLLAYYYLNYYLFSVDGFKPCLFFQLPMDNALDKDGWGTLLLLITSHDDISHFANMLFRDGLISKREMIYNSWFSAGIDTGEIKIGKDFYTNKEKYKIFHRKYKVGDFITLYERRTSHTCSNDRMSLVSAKDCIIQDVTEEGITLLSGLPNKTKVESELEYLDLSLLDKFVFGDRQDHKTITTFYRWDNIGFDYILRDDKEGFENYFFTRAGNMNSLISFTTIVNGRKTVIESLLCDYKYRLLVEYDIDFNKERYNELYRPHKYIKEEEIELTEKEIQKIVEEVQNQNKSMFFMSTTIDMNDQIEKKKQELLDLKSKQTNKYVIEEELKQFKLLSKKNRQELLLYSKPILEKEKEMLDTGDYVVSNKYGLLLNSKTLKERLSSKKRRDDYEEDMEELDFEEYSNEENKEDENYDDYED